MKHILIIGGSGFLGRHLVNYFSSYVTTTFTYHSSKSTAKNAVPLDITDKEQVLKVVRQISPDIIIHTAAVTNSNFCAENRNIAFSINVEGTKNIALAAEAVQAKLIYTSTDLVFDGEEGGYVEEDVPSPNCYYGKTKFKGEQVVTSLSSPYAIIRTALIYGLSVSSYKSFSEIIIGTLKQNKPLTLFTDEYRTPIYVKNYCALALELAKREELTGIFNFAGSERISRFELGEHLCDIFSFDKDLIIPVSVDDFTFKDTRPKDCSLKINKVEKLFTTPVWKLQEGLQDMLASE